MASGWLRFPAKVSSMPWCGTPRTLNRGRSFLRRPTRDTRALSISPDGRLLACQHGDDGLILLDVQRSGAQAADSLRRGAGRLLQPGRPVPGLHIGGSVRLWNVSHHQEVAVLAHPWRVAVLRQPSAPTATLSPPLNAFPFGSHLEAGRLRRKTGPVRARRRRPLRGLQPGREGTCIGEQGPAGEALGHRHRPALRTLPRFESSIQSVAFSPDGRLLATGQFGPTSQPVQIWDLATLQAITHPMTT